MSERLVAIVNPRSNLGATGRRLDELRSELDARLSRAASCAGAPSYTMLSTERPGHASELAQQAIREGATYLIACGGDGTISEVIEGIMRSGAAERVALSVLSRGTGGDFMRSLNAYAKIARASSVPLARPDGGGRELRLDLARAEFTDKDGGRGTRHVLNVASMGMSAEAVRWIDSQGRLGKRHRGSYLLSAVVGLARYRVAEFEVRVDGARLYRGPLQIAAVANGAFFGGGMPVAPDACLDDGLLEVVCMEPPGALRLLPFFMSFLRGKHIGHPLTHSARAHEVTLSSDREVWLEIDGEPVGTLPARIEVLPARLRVRVL